MWRIFKKKKHKHVFEFDGGQCLKCGKTMIEIWDESRERKREETINKFLNFKFGK